MAKGNVFLIIIKAIKANKSGIYDDLLTEEDKKVLSERIIKSAWYPFEIYKNCFNAIAKVIAQDNMEIVKQWGRNFAKQFLSNLYKKSFSRRGLEISLVLYNRFYKLWFNFGSQVTKLISEHEARLSYKDFDPEFKVFYYMASGFVEYAFSLFTEKEVHTKFVEKSWKGDKITTISIVVSHSKD
ncbi:MAG: hypothetical protein ACFFAS_13180 [Promethearchaeota archaeon]